jgi:hypothetical protein
VDADDALDHADLHALLVEDVPLLDVELEVGRDAARFVPSRGEVLRVAADARDLLRQGYAVTPRAAELFVGDQSDVSAAAGQAALLVAPDYDLQRAPVAVAGLGQGVRHLDGRHRAHVAVVVAAVRHRVDVRAEQDRLGSRHGARTHPHDVAHGVDANLEIRLAHQAGGELATRNVGVAVGHAAHAALRGAPVAGQVGEMPVHARAVDADRSPVVRLPATGQCR